MYLKSGRPLTRNEYKMASHLHHIITTENQSIGMLTTYSYIEAFNHFEEACADQWVKQGDKVTQLILRMKTAQNPLWETKQEYIKK